jgi:hypothetical protein
LFIVVEEFRNYVFEEDAPTATALMARVVIYNVFIERVVVYASECTHLVTSEEAHLIENWKF